MMIKLLNSELLKTYNKYPLLGIILFTKANASLIKMLEDKAYWNSLDEISGKQIGIFSTRLFDGKSITPDPTQGVLHEMKPIWKEPNENKEILSWFGLDSSKKLPQFVVFSFNTPDNGIHYKRLRLDDSSENRAYESVKIAIEQTVLVVKSNNVESLTEPELLKKLGFRFRVIDVKNSFNRLVQMVNVFRGTSGI